MLPEALLCVPHLYVRVHVHVGLHVRVLELRNLDVICQIIAIVKCLHGTLLIFGGEEKFPGPAARQAFQALQ